MLPEVLCYSKKKLCSIGIVFFKACLFAMLLIFTVLFGWLSLENPFMYLISAMLILDFNFLSPLLLHVISLRVLLDSTCAYQVVSLSGQPLRLKGNCFGSQGVLHRLMKQNLLVFGSNRRVVYINIHTIYVAVIQGLKGWKAQFWSTTSKT